MIETAKTADFKELLKFENRVFKIKFENKVPKVYRFPESTALHGIHREGGRIAGGICILPGAFIIGILSVLAGGCPLRQHVKAAGGNKSAIVYLGGFYVGVIVYMLFLNDFFKALFK